MNVFLDVLKSACLSVCPSVCPSMCLCVRLCLNTSFCQSTGMGIKSHLVAALVDLNIDR